jgi:hypothetical protein
MATIIIRNSTGSGVTPSSLVQGELAINTVDGKLFYGSGSGNIVKEFTGSGGGSAISASYALTASFATNGGVTQLLAGPNVTLSPTNGKGQVTVSATLSGSTIFNTSTGSYGSFYDTTTQTNPVGNIPRSMSLNTTDITNGVAISGSTNPYNTYIKTTNAGVYNIQFSAQVDKTDSGNDEIVIWLRKNGIDLTDTATTLTLSGNNDKKVAAWNWFVNSAANDYYQIIWISLDTNLRLLAEPISGTHPGIPSVILTANRVDQFLSNTGSFSGSFNGLFTGSLFGTASNALTASYLNTLNQDLTFNGNLTLNGTASISTLVVNQTQYSSGSNQLGDAANDTQTLYGSVIIPTGSLTVSGSTIIRSNTLPNTDSVFQVLSARTTSSFNVINNNSVEIGANRKITFYPDVSNNNSSYISLSNLLKSYELYSSGINGGVFFIYNRSDSKSPIVVTPDKIGLGINTDFSSATLAGAALIVTASNVGIGTAAPTASLHISASNSSSAFSFLVQNSAGNTLIGVQNDRTVNINSTNAANGNTTIGTTNGSVIINQGYNNSFRGNSINFYSGGDASTIQGFTGNPGIAVGYAQTNTNPNTGSVFTVKGTAITSGSGVLFVTGSSTTKLLTIASETNSSILVVSGSGLIGVGTSNPSANIHIANSSSAAFRIQNVGGSSADFSISAGNSRFEMVGNGASSGRITILQGAKYVGINQQTPTAAFHIVGAGATSATTAFLVQNSTPTSIFTILDNGLIGINRAPTSSLDVAGTTRLSGSFNTAISGSILTVIGSGSTQPIFTVQGSQGELFSVTDSLSGSLFSVNDISGLPILEVFSDNTTLIGDYQDPMLITTKKVTMTNSGSFVVYSLPTASYDTAFFDYSIRSGSNGRAGQIMAFQSGSSVNFTETTTTDFGSTSAVSFTVLVSGSNMVLTGSAATGSWTIKTIVRGL